MQALGLIWGDTAPFAQNIEEVTKPLREPVHFGARLLSSNWREKQNAGGFQLGRDLPSRALSSTLRNLIVYEPVDDAKDFRVRLAGSGLLRRFGRDVTGMTLSGIFGAENFARHRKALAALIAGDRPCSVDVTLKEGRRSSLHFEVLGLPVRSENGARWALAGIFYHDWAG